MKGETRCDDRPGEVLESGGVTGARPNDSSKVPVSVDQPLTVVSLHPVVNNHLDYYVHLLRPFSSNESSDVYFTRGS